MNARALLFMLLTACTLMVACSTPTQDEEKTTVVTDVDSVQDTLRILNKRIAENPNDPNLYYRRASIKWQEGDTMLALADADRAIDLEPDNTDYLYLRANLNYMRGRDADAQRDLDAAVKLESANSDVYYLMGSVYLLRKDYANALHWMDRAIKINKNKPLYYYGKAMVYRTQQQTARAITHANYALERDKNHIKSLALLADIYLNEQPDLAQARKYTYFILEADSLHPVGRFNMGFILYREAQMQSDATSRRATLQKAVEQYNAAINSDPGFANAHYQRGYVYQQLEQLDAAIADYKQCLKLHSKSHQAAFMLGSIYEAYEDVAQARKYYQQALDANPNFADARQALAELK